MFPLQQEGEISRLKVAHLSPLLHESMASISQLTVVLTQLRSINISVPSKMSNFSVSGNIL